MTTIKTFIGGHDAKKRARSHSNSRWIICMHQHHIQEEHGGNNEEHMGVYNVTLSKIKLSIFYGDNHKIGSGNVESF